MARFTIGSFSNQTIPDNGVSATSVEAYGINAITNVRTVSIELYDIRHQYADDLDMLLLGPAGNNLVFLSDLGGSGSYFREIAVADNGTYLPPDQDQVGGGPVWRPVNYGQRTRRTVLACSCRRALKLCKPRQFCIIR